MIDRRSVLTLSAAAAAAGCASPPLPGAPIAAGGVAPEITKRLGYLTPEDDPEFGPLITGRPSPVQTVGSSKSRHVEVSKAFRLLWDCPRTSDHMEIARYFENIVDVNDDMRLTNGNLAKYNQEWIGRANPLLVSFFGMTQTAPADGDETSWCAAFVSFVLHAAGKQSGYTASSGGYRRYPNRTNTPRIGDIVVFKKTGDEGNLGFGHVGFYLSHTDTTIEVLGGNQRAGNGSTGEVCRTFYKKDGTSLVFHSYRQVV